MALSYSVRPGGLTALSILNFVLGAGLFFKMIGTGWLISCAGSFGGPDGAQVVNLYIQLAFDFASMALLIVSGIGFLRMDRTLGQILSNVYVLVGIGQLVFQIATNTGLGATSFGPQDSQARQSGLDMGVLLNKLYLLVVFLFVNFVFADVWSKSGMLALAAKNARVRDGAVPMDTAAPGSVPKSKVLGLILDFSLRQSLRSASGVLTVFVGSSVVLWLAQIPYVFIDISRSLSGQSGYVDPALFSAAVNMLLRPVLAGYLGLVGEDTTWASSMMDGPSGIYDLSVILIAAIVPLFTVLISATQIASDNKNGGLRFLLPRVARDDIFRGKTGASLIVVVVMVFLLNLLNYAYFTFHYQMGDPATLFAFTLRGIFVHLMIAIPCTVLGVAVSGLIESPGVAWITATGIVMWPAIPFLLSTQVPAMRIGEMLMPHRTALYGFHPEPIMVAVAVAACVAYTALFYFGGKTLFRRRDL